MGKQALRVEAKDHSMTEDFVIKYLWSACGYGLMSIPILFPAARDLANAAALGKVHNEVAMRTESGSRYVLIRLI